MRMAVLLNRTRSDRSRSEVRLKAEDDRLSLRFPAGWLDEHPLVRADLIEEQSLLNRLGYRLEFDD